MEPHFFHIFSPNWRQWFSVVRIFWIANLLPWLGNCEWIRRNQSNSCWKCHHHPLFLLSLFYDVTYSLWEELYHLPKLVFISVKSCSDERIVNVWWNNPKRGFYTCQTYTEYMLDFYLLKLFISFCFWWFSALYWESLSSLRFSIEGGRFEEFLEFDSILYTYGIYLYKLSAYLCLIKLFKY